MVELPDLLTFVPEGKAKTVLRFCFDTLNLSVEETERTPSAAYKLISSIDYLLRAGSFSSKSDEEEQT